MLTYATADARHTAGVLNSSGGGGGGGERGGGEGGGDGESTLTSSAATKAYVMLDGERLIPP
jgi:hypothetical protein